MARFSKVAVFFLGIACISSCIPSPEVASASESPRHVTVFKQDGRFGGWPANNGMWSWGDEMLVGFVDGHFKQVERGHAIDGSKPSVLRFARSRDGGESWRVEVPHFLTEDGAEPEPSESPGGFDFTHPDAAVSFRMISSREGYSRFYYSSDRGHRWQGPYKIPTYGRTGIAARTDYLVNGPHELMAFMTAHKENGREGRVFNVRTVDGGRTWEFVSWIGPEPAGFSIMPSSVRLSPSRILTMVRRKEGDEHWIESWISDDNGTSWTFLNRVASTGGSVGNPPAALRLRDGRVAVTYGYRSSPFGIRARISTDSGQNWGEEIILRADGGNWDLGYPRTAQREDGRLVTVYYFNDHADQERYIAATIWNPDSPPAADPIYSQGKQP